jgi:methyl-accepting chemotaxis protein
MDRFRQWLQSYGRELRHGTAYLGLAMVIVIWAAAALHLVTFRNQLFESIRQNSANLTRAFERDVYNTLRSVDWTIQLLRRTYVDQGGDTLNFAGLTKELTNADGVSIQYVIIGPDGIMLMSSAATSSARLDLSDREHFRVHLASNRDDLFVSKPILGKVTGRWTIQLTRRIIRPDGAFGGVIVASVDPGRFSRLYNAIDVGQSGAIALIGQDGVVRSLKGPVDNGAGQDVADSRLLQVASRATEGPFNEVGPVDEVRRLGSFRHVEDFPLIVTVGFAADEILADYRAELGKTFGAATLLSLLLLLGVGFSIRNRLTHRATADALQAAEQLARARDLELKAGEQREASLRRDAAMRREVEAFNVELVQSIKAFGAMIDGLGRASDALSTAAAQAREGSGNVADAANRAAHRVAEVAAATDRLVGAADEVADRTRESSTIFRETVSDAEATNTTIESLNHAVHQIDSVVGTIRKIADQTNLLALNATIEAARAGDAGRGFSVVAAEVKALANQTASATQVIRDQIDAIREAGTASIAVLQGIRTQIAAAENISGDVSTTVAGHRTSAREIAETIRATAAETEEVSVSAKALAQATRSASESVANVLQVAGELSKEAARISSAVDGFVGKLQSA